MRREKEKLFNAGLELLKSRNITDVSYTANSFVDIIDDIYIKLFEETIEKLYEEKRLSRIVNDPMSTIRGQTILFHDRALYVFSAKYSLLRYSSEISVETYEERQKYIEKWKYTFNEERDSRDFAFSLYSSFSVYIYNISSKNQLLQYDANSSGYYMDTMSMNHIWENICFIDNDDHIVNQFNKYLLKKYSSINLTKATNGLLEVYFDNNFPTLLANTLKFKEYIFLLNDMKYCSGAKEILGQKNLTMIEAYYIVNKAETEEQFNIEHISKNIAESADLFEQLEDEDISWVKSMYAKNAIQEILLEANSTEEVTLDSMMFMISLINEMKPRAAVLSLKKVVSKIAGIKEDLLVIPVIEYLSRLVEYQGFRIKDVADRYLDYVLLLELHKDFVDINDLTVIFPPAFKKSFREQFIKYNLFTNNSLNVLNDNIEINKELYVDDYRLTLLEDINSYGGNGIPYFPYNESLKCYKIEQLVYEIKLKDLTVGILVISGIDTVYNNNRYISYEINIPLEYHRSKFNKLFKQKAFDINNFMIIKSA